MIAYCGQTRSPLLVQRLIDHGVGECTVRGELLSRQRSPWFYDNGAFRDWKAGKAFGLTRWDRDQRRMRYSGELPDFTVVPDVVAECEESLAMSRRWRPECVEAPAYLAVQDGMTADRVARFFAESADDGDLYDGVFVGGSLQWKLDTAAEWVRFAHRSDRRCHVGRVGTGSRVRWARSIGADSIDSCLPLMHEQHLVSFLKALS